MLNSWSHLQDVKKKKMDIRISVIFNGGFKFTLTLEFHYFNFYLILSVYVKIKLTLNLTYGINEIKIGVIVILM